MAFAETTDVETRLGRELSQAEADMASQVIDIVTDLIASAAGKDVDWATALDPVPTYFKELCIEKVIDAGVNPEGFRTETESLGAYSHTVSYPNSNAEGESQNSTMLSDAQARMVRKIVFGRLSGSFTPGTVLDEIPEWQNLGPIVTPAVDSDADGTPTI